MAQLRLSGDHHADQLVSDDPLALLIGMVLDQQITIEQAFRGPSELVRRLGLTVPIDSHHIAAMDPDILMQAFSQKPSIHRYPASMATRVQELCRTIAREYSGDASCVWSGARDGTELRTRVEALPGFGQRKAKIFVALCGKQLGICPPGWEHASLPFSEPGSFLSVADVVDAASLAEVRRRKREAKAAAKIGGKPGEAEASKPEEAVGPLPAGAARNGGRAPRTTRATQATWTSRASQATRATRTPRASQ
jgi:uncharacterized HhH-GPD family protein